MKFRLGLSVIPNPSRNRRPQGSPACTLSLSPTHHTPCRTLATIPPEPLSHCFYMKNDTSPEIVEIVRWVGDRDAEHHEYCSRMRWIYAAQ